MKKVWFITGAGKGIGHAIATAALKAGDYVVATTRKEKGFIAPEQYAENALNLTLDVSDWKEDVYNTAVAMAVKSLDALMCLLTMQDMVRLQILKKPERKPFDVCLK